MSRTTRRLTGDQYPHGNDPSGSWSERNLAYFHSDNRWRNQPRRFAKEHVRTQRRADERMSLAGLPEVVDDTFAPTDRERFYKGAIWFYD